MRTLTLFVVLSFCGAAPAGARRADPPRDVPVGIWAAASVQEVLGNGVMSLRQDGTFGGSAQVTRTQAVMALAKLARALDSGTWHAEHSVPVPQKVMQTLEDGDWQRQPVNRYTLAVILARFGDYIANSLPRPAPGSADLGKSTVLVRPKVTLARSNPAYESLTYLADNRMIRADSPLFKPDSRPVLSGQLGRALAEMAAGLTDRLTALGHDEQGNTIDINSHKKQPPAPK